MRTSLVRAELSCIRHWVLSYSCPLDGQPKFAVFDIVLGTIYATACAIEVFGVIAAATVRPLGITWLVLSVLTATELISATASIGPPLRHSIPCGLLGRSSSRIHTGGDPFRIQGMDVSKAVPGVNI